MYAIFFDYDNNTYRLPVNPEEIETNTVQANQKYEILKLGQIVIPTHMDLIEYSFEVELPHEQLHYVETSNSFKDADYYLRLLNKWRKELKPVRFIASNGIGDDINTLVLIEELSIVEKAGEEGDKYISFNLLEYRPYGKKSAVISTTINPTFAIVKQDESKQEVNPKANDYHVVQSGDSLYAIAKKYYGNGNQYTKIADANKDKVKNPALIYPGQKLAIPS